jgi:AhpD family alkylhydroperoxidase
VVAEDQLGKLSNLGIDLNAVAEKLQVDGVASFASAYDRVLASLENKRSKLMQAHASAWESFSRRVFADGALPSKTKDLIAAAVAHVTQCPYCIRGHTKRAILRGATEQEIMEAVWVADEMRAGAATSHSALAIDAMVQEEDKPDREQSKSVPWYESGCYTASKHPGGFQGGGSLAGNDSRELSSTISMDS